MGWLGQASEHESDHGEAHERGDGSRVSLEVARQASIAADPGEGSLDDPAFGQDDELVPLAALDDFDNPMPVARSSLCHAWSLIAGIGEDVLDEREKGARAPIDDEPRAVAILHVARVNDDVQQEAERVNEDMPLAARDLLARIEALRVEPGTPF